MTSGDQVTARVRIVRCPRCHHLLPELPDFTIYKCGGCNAILKAKSQKTGNLASGVQSNGAAQTAEFVDRVSDDGDLGVSSTDAITLSSYKSHQNLNNIAEQMKSDDNDQGKPVDWNSDCQRRNGTESVHSENEPTEVEGGVAEEELYVENLAVGDANDEGVSPEIHHSSSPVQLRQPCDDDDIVHPGSAQGKSCVDKEPDPSELNDVLLHSTKYPAENCVPVDGGMISEVEKLDQLPEPRLNFSHDIHKASSDVIFEEERARDEFFVRNMISKLRESESEHRQRSSRSNLSDNDRYIMKGGKRDPIGNRTRFGRERNLSQGLLYARGSQNGNVNDNILYPDWNDSCSDQFLDPEEEKMNLLRLVHELQDQLNKSRNFNRNANGFVSGPLTWRTHPEEILSSPYHLENLGRHTAPGYETRQHRFSRVPLSGGASSSGSQIDQPAYLHPHRHDIHRSMPLHPGLYRFNHDLNFHSSCPSSPQHYLSSQYAVAQGHRSHELHKHSRQRHPLAKRHFRPMAGGAPFITCYNCFKPLQIPADFLLSKRRRHRLRCGACSVVLEFFLRGSNHIVPCTESTPKEDEEFSDDVYEHIRASASYGADPMSRSDDYGLPPSTLNRSRNTDRKPLNYGDQRREFGLKQSQKTSKNPVESYQSRGPPHRSSKAEKLSVGMNRLPPTAPGSPLHRLMGYSTISQIINESGPSKTRVQKRG